MDIARAAEELIRLQERAVALPPGILKDIEDLFAFLVESEDQTLALIAYLKDPAKPPLPPGSGDIEFGFVLHWIHYPPPEVWAIMILDPALLAVYEILKDNAPPTKITREAYAKIEGEFDAYGEPGPDGTLYGPKKYQQFDKDWIWAALNYALNVIVPESVDKFPNNPPATIALCRKDHDASKDPVLGIVGDWGAGYYTDEGGVACPAKRVMEQITGPGQSPPVDYLIHLGDVYYAGTDWRLPLEEEWKNFYDLWPDQGAARNFTLNSNHEMYGAGSGYFKVSLKQGGLFAAQNGMSYFSMTYGPWLVLCLDSAYYSDAFNGREFYMNGAIGTNVLDQQIKWLQQFRNTKGPIMVMTHHGGGDTLTAAVTPLYKQVLAALGRPPTLWYWGHVHNGIVYDKLYDLGTRNPVITYPTKGRVCGHGSIPFGNAWGLEDRNGKTVPNVLYYAHTPDPDLPETSGNDPANPRVCNGYALVTLHPDGGFTERFYETCAPQPVFERRWSAAELEAE